MRALTVIPGTPGSARLEDLPEPTPRDGELLIQAHALGVCGTDMEIIRGEYGTAPPGQRFLVLGHESLGRVIAAPDGSGFAAGDWVCSIVRRPDPVPCASCARGEWDMCQNGRYTEHGIQGLDGFSAERYVTAPRFAVKVAPSLGELGVLLEPTSVVAKAWQHIDRIGARAYWAPERVLVIGAGPIGLLAALLGVQRGLDVHVLDRVTSGPKPGLVAALGATYHSGSIADAGDADVVLECTGARQVVFEAMFAARPNGIVCLTGVSAGGHPISVDAGALSRELVLQNHVVFGSVNANRAHYDLAAQALAKADAGWLARLVTRRVPLDDWASALERRDGDVKTTITFT
jgi:threonine dehydrogenase-like Zn-dependent dehydrogenase